MMRSEAEQKILDLSLYNAVLREDVEAVKSLLDNGAMVKEVEPDKNKWRMNKFYDDGYTYHGKTYVNALDSAAKRGMFRKGDTLEIFALLIQHCKKSNNDRLIFTSMINEFAYDSEYSQAIADPDTVLARKKKTNPFRYTSLEDVQFADNSNPKLADLNLLIVTVYEQAKSMFERAGFFTIGMKDKARKILSQLIELKRWYNDEPNRLNTLSQATGIQSYFSKTPNGLSLENIIKAKRHGNLFVTYADSWKQIGPRIEGTPTPPVYSKGY